MNMILFILFQIFKLKDIPLAVATVQGKDYNTALS